MSTLGTKTHKASLYVAGDTDGLIAVLNAEDVNHDRALAIVDRLDRVGGMVAFPATCVVETVTTLIRRLNKPHLAEKLIQSHLRNLWIEPVDQVLIDQALKLFDPQGSKQNTLFDAVVAALADKVKTKLIFSFDTWYSKRGYTLAEEMKTRNNP